MITMTELNALYIDKLQRTGSHDEAIRKVWWDAYNQGARDALTNNLKESGNDQKTRKHTQDNC